VPHPQYRRDLLLCRRHFPPVEQITIRLPLEIFPQVTVPRVCCVIVEDMAVLLTRVLTVGETRGSAGSVVKEGGGVVH
jgi:hypothetical protein